MNQAPTILFVTDFSEPSRQAFRLAQALAQEPHGRLIVLHVAHPGGTQIHIGRSVVYMGSPCRTPEKPRPSAEESAPSQGTPANGAEHKETALREILDLAERTHCDWIVLGTKAHTSHVEQPLVPTAEQVVSRAPCHVLTIASA